MLKGNLSVRSDVGHLLGDGYLLRGPGQVQQQRLPSQEPM